MSSGPFSSCNQIFSHILDYFVDYSHLSCLCQQCRHPSRPSRYKSKKSSRSLSVWSTHFSLYLSISVNSQRSSPCRKEPPVRVLHLVMTWSIDRDVRFVHRFSSSSSCANHSSEETSNESCWKTATTSGFNSEKDVSSFDADSSKQQSQTARRRRRKNANHSQVRMTVHREKKHMAEPVLFVPEWIDDIWRVHCD